MKKFSEFFNNKFNINNALITIGIIIESFFLLFTILQNSEKSILLYIIIYFVTAVISITIFYLLKHNNKTNNKSILIILLFGILFRLTLIPTVPSTSDDVYRYTWEGKLIVNGENPFATRPDDVSLNYLHSDKYPELVSFPHMTTIYPPFAQTVFALAYIISGENDIGLKFIYLLFEILSLLLILKILRLKKISQTNLILYAWFPLPIMEFFINSHLDCIGITLFLGFLYLFLKEKYYSSAILFALAILSKLYPIFFIPLIIKHLRFHKASVFIFITFLITALAFIPFIPQDRSVNTSLFTYLSNWSFNGSFYSLMNLIFDNGYIARTISAALFMICVARVSLKSKDFVRSIITIWICFIVFAATLYPWYISWVAAINPFVGLYSVITILFTSNLANITPYSDVWREYWWVYILEYTPFYIFLVKDFNMIKKLKQKFSR